nr:MAG TPA: hypothetical protein [Bacteriophage sp.]
MSLFILRLSNYLLGVGTKELYRLLNPLSLQPFSQHPL